MLRMRCGNGCLADEVVGETESAVETRRGDWAALDQGKQNTRKPRMDSWVRTEKNVRTEVYSVRPDGCPGLGVQLNLLEESYALQLTEHSPVADDPLSEIDCLRRPITETQSQAIAADVSDSPNSWKHQSSHLHPHPYPP